MLKTVLECALHACKLNGVLVTNAFSIGMLSGDIQLDFIKIDKETAREVAQSEVVESAVGHADTAAVISDDLGISVAANRTSVVLAKGLPIMVAQYTGPRLPEGTMTLPEGAVMTYWLVY